MNWDFIVFFGTLLFWALLHVWSPDGRQWRDDQVDLDASPALDPVASAKPRSRP